MKIQGTDCVEHQCSTCGVWFAMPRVIYENAYNQGGFWTCPNGHRRGWSEGQTPRDIDRLRLERNRLKQRSAQQDDAIKSLERSVSAHKAQVTKLKKRAAGGACPCCNRTFANLARHMKSKHPEFSTEDSMKVIEGGAA